MDRPKGHMKNFVIAVLKGLKREMDSVKAIGSTEVGITCEEPNVLELDEYRLEVYRKRPRSRATDKGLHVIPTKWVDVNKGGAKRPKYP